MIRIEHLTKRFDNVVAVDDFSTTFEPGITGLVGQNGSGKSTLFRLISGVYKGDGGEVFVNDVPASEVQAKEDVFFLSDDPYAPRGARIAGVLDFYQSLFDIDADEFNRLIDAFGLPREKAIGFFSKGMRRQTFIALALSMKASHLLLDEAFDGIDPLAVDVIKNHLVEAASKGKTIVISSHNIFALQKLVDRFLIVSGGKVSKKENNESMGNEFVKFQAAFKDPVNEYLLIGLGLNLVSFHYVGSVAHFVLLGEKEPAQKLIEEKLHPLFLETVPLEPEEVVSLEMMVAKKQGGSNHA